MSTFGINNHEILNQCVLFGPGDRQRMLDEAGPFDLIVCSYGLLQTESERLAGVAWSTVVADEAQAIKNTRTKRSRAAMALQADFRMITTGTPIENHLGELWNLFRFILTFVYRVGLLFVKIGIKIRILTGLYGGIHKPELITAEARRTQGVNNSIFIQNNKIIIIKEETGLIR